MILQNILDIFSSIFEYNNKYKNNGNNFLKLFSNTLSSATCGFRQLVFTCNNCVVIVSNSGTAVRHRCSYN